MNTTSERDDQPPHEEPVPGCDEIIHGTILAPGSRLIMEQEGMLSEYDLCDIESTEDTRRK